METALMDPRIRENLGRFGLRPSEVNVGHHEEAREDDLDVPECILQLMFDIPWNDEGPFYCKEGDQDRIEVIFQGPEEFDEDEDPDIIEEYGELVVFGTLSGAEQRLVFQAEDGFDDPVFYIWDPEGVASGESLSELGDFDNLLGSLHRHATDPQVDDELDLEELLGLELGDDDEMDQLGL